MVAAALFLGACHALLSLDGPDGVQRVVDARYVADGAAAEASSDAGVPSDPCEAGPDLPPATGKDDDPTVELPRGRSTEGSQASGTKEQDGGPSPRTFVPTWDGCDQWHVRKDESDLTGKDTFPRATTAFVSNGVLVVDGGQIAPFFIGAAHFELRDAKLRGRSTRISRSPRRPDSLAGNALSRSGRKALVQAAATLPNRRLVVLQRRGPAAGPRALARATHVGPFSAGAVAIGDPARVDVSARVVFDARGPCGDSLLDGTACPAPSSP